MNPFQYRLGQITKSVISVALMALALLAFFVAYDPALVQAVPVLLTSLSTVVAVFYKPNVSVADATKAIEQLKGSVLTVLAFIITVEPSLEMQIAAATTALISFYPVWKLRNAHPPTVVEDEVEEVPELPVEMSETPGGIGQEPVVEDMPLNLEEGEEAREARKAGVPPTEGTV